MVAATDSEDSSLQVGPPRQAPSPQPTRPSTVSKRTNTKVTASKVVNDILCGRATGMPAWITRTLAIFMGPFPRESPCSRPEDVGFGVDAPDRNRPGGDGPLSPLVARPSSTISADEATPCPERCPGADGVRALTRASGREGRTPSPSRRSRRQPLAHGVVDHPYQRGDVEDGQPGDGLNVGAVRRHVGALENDGTDLRMRLHEASRHGHVLLAGHLDVEFDLVVEEDPS